MATSTRPVRATLPERAKTLVPLLVGVPTALNQSAPSATSIGTLASVSTLLMIVGLPNKPLTAGNGGRGRGMPRRPSMLWISAVSSPHTNAPAPILITISRLKSVPRMLWPSKPIGLGLGQGRLQPLDGQRVLGPDVDVGLGRADGVGGEHHAFDQPVRVAFDHGPVHERAGVALVGVADQVLLVALGLAGELPLLAGGKAAAAPAAQAAGFDHVADLLRRVLLAASWPGPGSRRGRCTRRSATGSIRPQLASTQRVCGAKNGCSSKKGTSSQGCSVAWRCWARASLSGIWPAKIASSRPSTLSSVTCWKVTRVRPGTWTSTMRLRRAQADAAHFDHVGLDLVAVEVRANGVQRFLAPAPSPQVPSADEDRRTHQAIPPQFGQAVLPLLTHRLVLRAVRLQQPGQEFRIRGKRPRRRGRCVFLKQLRRHSCRPFSDRSPESSRPIWSSRRHGTRR